MSKEQIEMRSIPDKSNCEQIFKCDGKLGAENKDKNKTKCDSKDFEIERKLICWTTYG